jgi:hypothetical protein
MHQQNQPQRQKRQTAGLMIVAIIKTLQGEYMIERGGQANE